MTSHHHSNYNSQLNTLNSIKNIHVDPMIGKIVCKNYQILSKINEGSFGKVYMAIHQIKKEYFAVKIEVNDKKKKIGETLRFEAEILQKLNGEKGIPRLYYYIEDRNQRVLVETLLGQNLDELFIRCKKKFSLKTVLMFMDQAINRLEYLHSMGYIHRDIKPENFVIGLTPFESSIYLIDFGLNLQIFDQNQKHIERNRGQPLVGTARFTPICSHQGYTQNRASDLESLGYLAMYFLKGTLPWMGIEGSTKEERFYLIGQKKQRESPQNLCAGYPKEFESYFNYIMNLSFDSTPSYAYIRKMFRTLFMNKQFQNDDKFDWVPANPTTELSMQTEMPLKRSVKFQNEQKQIPEQDSSEEADKLQSQVQKSSGMLQSKDSKHSSQWGRSQTVQDNQRQLLMSQSSKGRRPKHQIQLSLQTNKIVMDRAKQHNSMLSKRTQDNQSENLQFTYCDEYYPYPTLDEHLKLLPPLHANFRR